MGVVVFRDPAAALFFFLQVLLAVGQALLPPSGFNRPLSTDSIGFGCVTHEEVKTGHLVVSFGVCHSGVCG